MEFIPKSTKIKDKRELTKRALPSHIPTKEFLEKANITEEGVKQLPMMESFLRGHKLPTNIDRNIVATNFNKQDQLVILFDTGERITTSAINIKEYVEQYVTVQAGTSGGIASNQEVFIGEPITAPSYPAIIFQDRIIDGQTVYTMRVNVP